LVAEQDALQLRSLAEAAYHSQTNYGIARERYDAGGISQLSLIDAQKQSQQTEYDQIAVVAARLKDTAAFLTAIGGGS
jgi:outer membrane protein TolC